MNVGKLFQAKKLYWLLYPSKDIAPQEHVTTAVHQAATAVSVASGWCKELNCNVSYIEPNSIFCLLEQDGNFMKILSNNGELGWIILADWCKNYIEEVNQ